MHNVRAGAIGEGQGGSSASPAGGDQQIVIERLGDHHKIAEFVCCKKAKSPRVQDFLQKQALGYERKNFARIFVASPRVDPGKVLGFYSLSAALVKWQQLSKSQQKTGPGSIDFPMVKLGFMGRCDDLPDGVTDLGSVLLYDAAKRVREVTAIAVWGFVLDAELGEPKDPENDKLVKWYRDHGFASVVEQDPEAKTHMMYARLEWLLPK